MNFFEDFVSRYQPLFAKHGLSSAILDRVLIRYKDLSFNYDLQVSGCNENVARFQIIWL